jgi:nitroreductase
MQILDMIKTRRSVRRYKQRKVPLESIYYILEAARWAPSTANIQNWRFIVIEDPDTRNSLSKATLGQDWVADAPVLLIVCSLDKSIKRKFPKYAEKYSIQNTSAAVENILLAAMGVGLSSCWITAFSENRVRRVCQIPDDVGIHAIVTLGYANERPVPVARHDLWDIVHFEGWNTRTMDKIEYLKGEDSKQLFERKFVKDAQSKINRIKSKIKKPITRKRKTSKK